MSVSEFQRPEHRAENEGVGGGEESGTASPPDAGSTYDGAPGFAVEKGLLVRQVEPERETQPAVRSALGGRRPGAPAPRCGSQVLFLSGEGVRQVLDVLGPVFLHVGVQRLQDLTHQGADLPGDAARLLDFVNLPQTEPGGQTLAGFLASAQKRRNYLLCWHL